MNHDEFAKRLIGRPGRLRLAKWILSNVAIDGYFYQDAARTGTGDVINEVRENLHHLELLGMIKTAHRDPGPGRRLHYKRTEAPAWAVYEAALSAVMKFGHESRRVRRAGGQD